MMQNENRIRIGNQTAFMAASPLEPFYYAVENGFDAFEWFPDKKENGAGWDLGDIQEQTRSEIRETAGSHDMLLTVHIPWWTSPLRPEAEEVFQEQILFAGQIGAGLINLHLSIEAGVEQYAAALLPAIRATREAGLRLAVENTPLTPPEAFNRLFAWWGEQRDVSISHVGMCLDLGHANLCEATRNDYIRYLDQLGPQVPIIHMHLHENYGDRDSHLPIFTGPAGQNDAGVRAALERLVKRGFCGTIILEQWPEPHSLLRDGRTRLLDILKGYQPPAKKQRPPPAAAPSEVATVEVPVKKERLEKPRRKKATARKPASVPPKKPEESLFFNALVKMDRKRRSWREKLEGTLTLLADENFSPTSDNRTYLAIYLR
ncbi:MAG: sugar phosphate isomerase/epimerase, partial [Deltaproteobacteria bacterium]